MSEPNLLDPKEKTLSSNRKEKLIIAVTPELKRELDRVIIQQHLNGSELAEDLLRKHLGLPPLIEPKNETEKKAS